MRKLFLLLAGTILLSSCEKTVDVSSLQEEIKTNLNQQSGLSVKSVHCPANVKVQPDSTFECTGELNPDGGFFITVKQEPDGKAKWEVPSSWRLLNLAALEAEFKQKLNASEQNGLRISCGNLYRATKPGDSFECQLLRKEKADSILVKVEPEGQVKWQEVRTITAPEKNAKEANASNTVASTASTPAPGQESESQSPVPPGAAVKDATGWAELND